MLKKKQDIASLPSLSEDSPTNRSVLDAIPDPVVVLQSGVCKFANKAFRDLSGYSDADVQAEPDFMVLVQEADRDRVLKLHADRSSGEDVPSNMTIDLLARDGTPIPCETSTGMVCYEGEPAALVIIRSIHHRRQTERALRESQEQYRALIDGSTDAIYVYDTQGKLLLINHTGAADFNRTPDELIGQHISKLLPQKDSDAAAAINKVLELGEPTESENVVEFPGGRRHLWSKLMPLRDMSGAIKAVHIVSRDMTEQRKAEEHERDLQEQLARAHRIESLGLLAGGVAHDLNNILGPMVALPTVMEEELLELVGEESEEVDELLEDIHVIHSAARRAANVIKDLMTLSRRGNYEREQIDIGQVIRDYARSREFTKFHEGNSRVSISKRLYNRSLPIAGSESHLIRALSNLVNNAVEAVERKGKVLIKTSRVKLAEPLIAYETIEEGEYALVTVSDTGSGIASVNLDRIFEPFFTKKVQNEKSGSGLGLSIVHGVVKDHDGFINVESQLGKGTTFSLYLPLALIDGDGKGEPEPVRGGTERILVVDDEPSQRFIARKQLEKLGYQVTDVLHGKEALVLFQETCDEGLESPFDLILLDMIMEDNFDGLDTFEAIAKLYPQQKVVIVSGYAPTRRGKAAIDLGADWLSKPYEASDLGRITRQKLDEFMS